MVGRVFCMLLVVGALASAGEPVVEPATLRLPADTRLVVRISSLDRLDAIGKEFAPLLEMAGVPQPLSAMFVQSVAPGLSVPLDRTRPIFTALAGDFEAVWILPADRAEPIARQMRLRDGRFVVHQDKLAVIAQPWVHEAPRRTEPFACLGGDFSCAVDIGAVIEDNKSVVDEARTGLDGLKKQKVLPIPAGVVPLVEVAAGLMFDLVDGLDQFHYALTWKDGRLESEGWFRTRPRSKLNGFLRDAGAARPTALMGYLPRDALYSVESCGIAAWLDVRAGKLLDEALGDGAGEALLLLLSPSYALGEHLTGCAAGTVSLLGLTSGAMRSVHEVKQDAPIAEAIRALDAKRINATLRRLELPIEVRLKLDDTKYGETPIHRLSLSSPVPHLAMILPQMETRFAVEKGHLFVAQSQNPETDLLSLIDQVRRGAPRAHPHRAAMERLMPDRHEGLTLDFGSLQGLLGIFAFQFPELGAALKAFPDDLRFSTALAIRDGHVHFRGDWPVAQLLGMLEKLR